MNALTLGHERVEVLLVEDNDSDAELALRALRRWRPEDRVHRLRDGAEAVAFLLGTGVHAQQLRVILLDLKLPKVSGLDVLRLLKSDERTRSIPIVILTSSREDVDIVEGYRRGANSYVVKPVDFDEFIEAVGQLGSYWASLNQTQR